MNKTVTTLHRWVGFAAGLLILVAAGTAIALNHKDLWYRPDVSGGDSSPYRKYILAAAADPADPARMLVGTSDGLYRTADGGKTWQEAVLPVPAESAGGIQFDPARPGVVYVALRAIGVFRSADGGEVWEPVELPFYPPEGTHIAGLGLERSGALVLATTAGVYRQAAPGGEWRLTPKGPDARPADERKLAQLVYDLHDGRFWGTHGVLLTDLVSGALILLVGSGYALFFARAGRRRQARVRPVAVITAPPEAAAARKP